MRDKYPLDTDLKTINFGPQNTRIQGVFHFYEISTLRQLCQMRAKALLGKRGLGERCLELIEKTLQSIGLELDMSETEIAEYERTFQNANRTESCPPPDYDEIDWEARRYELAKALYLRKPTHTKATALDAFIEADTLVDVVAGFGSKVF